MKILPLLLVNFIGALGFSIVIPYLVFWLKDFGGSPALYGFLGATYAASQMVGAPILGKASDKIGRKKVLFLSQFGTLLSWLIILVALNVDVTALFETNSEVIGYVVWTLPLLLLFIGRLADGFTGGNISVANAYVADVSSEEERSKNFGRMSAASNVGFILGPAIAGIVGSDINAVFVAIIISVVGLFVILFGLPKNENQKKGSDPCKDPTRKLLGKEQANCFEENKSGFKNLLKIPILPQMFLLYFLLYLAFNFFYAVFPLQAQSELEWTARSLGYFFSALSAMMIFVQGPVLAFVSGKISEKKLAIFGSVVMAASMILLVNAQDLAYVSAALFALGNGLMWPSYMSLLSKLGDSEKQGAIQGFASSFGSMASIVGLLIGSVLFNQFGSNLFYLPTAIFVICGLIMLVSLGKIRT